MAGVESVTSAEFAVTPSTYSESKKNTSALGKDEFLNLLVKQRPYQDPLDPSSDTEFIAQMAQFSSLEQMQNLNDTFSKFQSYSMVGKYATANFGMETIEGYVESITSVGDTTYALINGTSVDVSEIYKVTDMAEELQVLTGILQQLVDKNGAEGSTENAVTEEVKLLDDILQELVELNNSKTESSEVTVEETNDDIVIEEEIEENVVE